MHRSWTLALLLLWSSAAVAGPRDFTILLPGAPATAEEARPYVDLLLAYLKSKVGGADFNGAFYGELAPGLQHLETALPGYGFVSAGVFLVHGAKHKMRPLAQLVYDGERASPYAIVVREGRYQGLEQLKGRQLAGGILLEAELFFRIALGGTYAAEDFELIPTTRTLRFLRKVAKDKVDAIVLDRRAVEGLDRLKLPAKVAKLVDTQPVPHPLFVAFGDRAPAAEQAKVQAALVALCRDPEGKKVCDNFGFDDFVAVTDADLAPLHAQYSAP